MMFLQSSWHLVTLTDLPMRQEYDKDLRLYSSKPLLPLTETRLDASSLIKFLSEQSQIAQTIQMWRRAYPDRFCLSRQIGREVDRLLDGLRHPKYTLFL